MIYLINSEFKKIIKSRITIITLSLSILLIISYVAITTLGERYKYSDNVEYKGLEAIHLDKEVQLQLKGILTEERISQIISKYNEITNNSSNVDQSNNLTPKAYFKYWKKYSIIESLISRSYGSILSSNIDAIKELAPSDGNRFYTNKYKQTKEYINSPNLSLNNKEKNIVLDELSKLDIPLKYNYNAGWTKLLWDMNIINYIVLVCLCICISPIYVSEYEDGVDAILLSSKYGKGKLNISKIIVSSLTTLFISILFVLITASLRLGIYGLDGWDSNIQVNPTYWHSIYNVNFLQAFTLSTLTVILSSMIMSSLILYVSSRSKTLYGCILVCISILLLPKFVNIGNTVNLLSKFLDLFPVNIGTIANHLGYYKFYNILGLELNYFATLSILFLTFIPIILIFVYKAFRNHQVSS